MAEEAASEGWSLQRLRALARLTWTRLKRLALMQLPAEEAKEVRQHVEDDGALTERYVLMCGLSAGIAILGLLQSSAAVVIGAMLVSPLMGPIAKLGFGIASLDGARMLSAARTVGAGAAMGVIVGITITWLSPIRNATPEIIARTAPTLLDLAVALLSGMAGGYATVHRRGETAIGVAIATALMPPLATVGYSIAVWRFDFVFGSALLFLTNLGAIAFSFAVVARVRGVARPFWRTKLDWRLVTAVVVALALLAVPLAMTLRRLTQEALATRAARQEIVEVLGIPGSMIAQLSVSWGNLERPNISAIAVTEAYKDGAEEAVRERLTRRLGEAPQLDLQQLVATDTRSETQAMISAALTAQAQAQRARAAPPPPVDEMRTAARMPTLGAWADTQKRVVRLLAAPAPGLSLEDLRQEETRLGQISSAWSAEVTPSFETRLPVGFANNATALDAAGEARIAAVIWALKRWGVTHVRLEGLSGRSTGATRTSRTLAETRVEAAAQRLRAEGIAVEAAVADRATSRALYAQGGEARVRGVDVLALARR